MNALNLDNWICDLYSHIDAQRYITGLDQRQYRDEIHWAYRLGYLTREEYYQLLECLDTMMNEKKKTKTIFTKYIWNRLLTSRQSLQTKNITGNWYGNCSCGMSAMIIPRRYIIIMDGGDEKQQISQSLDTTIWHGKTLGMRIDARLLFW